MQTALRVPSVIMDKACYSQQLTLPFTSLWTKWKAISDVYTKHFITVYQVNPHTNMRSTHGPPQNFKSCSDNYYRNLRTYVGMFLEEKAWPTRPQFYTASISHQLPSWGPHGSRIFKSIRELSFFTGMGGRLFVGGTRIFWGGPRGDQLFLTYAKGGPEKIDDPRSQTDAPPPDKKW